MRMQGTRVARVLECQAPHHATVVMILLSIWLRNPLLVSIRPPGGQKARTQGCRRGCQNNLLLSSSGDAEERRNLAEP
jgi:hypothetical protein